MANTTLSAAPYHINHSLTNTAQVRCPGERTCRRPLPRKTPHAQVQQPLPRRRHPRLPPCRPRGHAAVNLWESRQGGFYRATHQHRLRLQHYHWRELLLQLQVPRLSPAPLASWANFPATVLSFWIVASSRLATGCSLVPLYLFSPPLMRRACNRAATASSMPRVSALAMTAGSAGTQPSCRA